MRETCPPENMDSSKFTEMSCYLKMVRSPGLKNKPDGQYLFGTSQSKVKSHAHRLSELGFNIVRIHHQDSEWVVPNILVTKMSPVLEP